MIIVFLSACQGAATATKRCHDSDNTKLLENDPSYETTGHVLVVSTNKPVQSFVDTCQGKTLTEYYCEGHNKRQIKIDCETRCATKGHC